MTSDHLLSLIKLPVATAAGLLLFSLCVKADIPNDPFYCGERKLGFFFYCTKAGNTVKEEKQVAPPSTASERIRDIGAQLEDMRATAILDPTTENIAAYIRFQREQLDRASLFADMWQRTLWQQPELDYTLVRPVGHLSKKVWSDERVREQEALFASLGERYGIFYVYAGSCAACQAFSPLLRGFADRYGLTVKAVSVDGAPNEYVWFGTNRTQSCKQHTPLFP